ncbi:putative HTH-type transcriptional regulator YwbI [Thalassobacillus devorans]|uniref:HTH-type transcriptional regulator YwbI n=1 Tax=Thalassobacillus devorans TaxID=279813 RepID=A0ABQ1PR19_9BACI|nr:LysR family transcriptional regulator [Thalassobacillus devorans]NIK30569.1 DNA-binding transcriptional LysR family regulator [Thalassobacillus devorans]GGD01850.1 putative HTH-type transcriptional regulator YwbI [Thalassobacillus devorans]
MDIRHLEYFSEVAKQLSFTKAASTLHVSQPSLSKAIKQLEEELGVPLFYRAKQLVLTDAGKAVLVNAKNVLDAFHNLNSELNDVIDLKKGEVKIGIPPIIGAAFFSSVITCYKEKYPQVEILLNEVGSKMIKQGVEDGSLDIGLVCNLPSKNEDLFDVIEVINDPLTLVVHKDHPLASETRIDLASLENEPFIMYRQDFTLHDRILDECAKKGFTPNVVCHSSQRDFMIEMVEAKLGVALLPGKIAAEIMDRSLVSVPLIDSNASLELGMIWKKNKYLPFAVREFIETADQLLVKKELVSAVN